MNVLEEYFGVNGGNVGFHDIYVTLDDILNQTFTDLIERHPDSRAYATFKAISDMLNPLKGKRVLDVGCAVGYFTFLMVEAGAVAIGVECNPALATVASHILNVKKLDCVVANAKVENFLSEDCKYDATLLLNVFDQMLRENEQNAWKTLQRIQKTSKYVFIMTGATEQLPNMAGLRTSQPLNIPVKPQMESWELGHEMILRKGDFKQTRLLLRNGYAQRDLWVFY